MVSRAIIAILAAFLAFPSIARAQTTPPAQGTIPLEQRHEQPSAPRRPIVRPDGQRDQAVGEAERDAAEYERTQRGDSLVREQSRPMPRRPDLGYDVYSGIQQRNIQRR